MLVNARQERNTQGNTQKGGRQQPARAPYVDLPPVLYNHYGGDCDREQNGNWGCDLDWNDECEQWDSNQRFAKAKGRSNQSSEKYNQQNLQSGHHCSMQRSITLVLSLLLQLQDQLFPFGGKSGVLLAQVFQ